MAITRIPPSGIDIQALSQVIGGGPKVTAIQVTDSVGTILDDTAVALTGGFIRITGTGFASGAQVIVNNTPAVSTSFISSTALTAQVGAQVAGTYVVYVVNTDGGVAIAVNGITYSATPNWVTGGTLPSFAANTAISLQLSASEATTYQLVSGSTLPAGLTLTSGGLLSGQVSTATETTYSFVVSAVDAQLQDSPRTFSITITVGDALFNLTTLLIPGNGANNANNNTFLDSSTNNFTLTRSGNTTQGNFSPFSQTGWSNYFDGTGDYLTAPSIILHPSLPFTFECWFNSSDLSGTNFRVIACSGPTTSTNPPSSNGQVAFYTIGNTLYANYTRSNLAAFSFTATITTGTWYHVAIVRQTSGGAFQAFLNGVSLGTDNVGFNLNDGMASSPIGIGATAAGTYPFTGYVSNVRIVGGTSLYPSAFTPPVSLLTAVSGTRLLTCQSNRFRDASTNNFTITRNGDVSVQAFSPFSPSAPYSAATVGGSVYFDGTGDFLNIPANAAFEFGTGDFTVEAWAYLASDLTNPDFSFFAGTGGGSIDLTYTDSSFRFGRANVAWDSTFSHVLARRAWHHVAFTKESGVAKVYVNGVLVGSAANTQSYSTGNGRINSAADSGRQGIGYMSGHRVVKGTAVYTANFTPPTAPPTAIANTSLLLNFTNDPIADATSKNVIETVGDAKISTVQSKWGGSSIFFDGTGDRLIVPSSPNFDFPGNFTIEMWINLANVTSTWQSIISRAYAITGGWRLYKNDGTNQLSWWSVAAQVVSTTGSTLANNTWSHVAVVRNSGTITIYIDGVNRGSAANTTNYNPGNYALEIGEGVVTSAFPMTGYIQDLRITNGTARYTANFTPPASAFPLQ